MENNTDKKIADKLKGFEMPYEPEAWQEMEALLEKKKKRRGIFWWWFGGGIAASVLLGSVLWYALNKPNTVTNAAPTQVAMNTVESKSNKAQNSNSNEEQQQLQSKEQPKESTSVISANANEQTVKAQNSANGAENTVATNAVTINSNKYRTQPTAGKAGNRKKEKVKKLVSGTEEQQKLNELAVAASPKGIEEAEKLSEAAMLEQHENAAEIKAATTPIETTSVASAVTDSTLSAEALKDSTVESSGKKEEAKAGKKKVFSFHLGARSDFYGVIPLHEGYKDSLVNAKGAWRFAYAVGPDMEFMFGKHFSIYTGALYSYNSYKVNNPVVSVDALTLPDTIGSYGSILCKSYTSIAHELVIPIGFKAYPYVSDNFRLSIAAGVFNHIKLKEEFNTEITTTPPSSLGIPIVTPEDKFVTTSTNPFTNAYTDMYDNSPGTQAFEKRQSQANWFSVSGTSRYYASFYASIGAELVLKKNLRITAEPIYRMSISKIGEQMLRLHSFGCSIGFKYRIGK
ncbi:MAG: outer membrane beta-barrel protein [Chitinophagales bacterium]